MRGWIQKKMVWVIGSRNNGSSMDSQNSELLERLGVWFCRACGAHYPVVSSWYVCAPCMKVYLREMKDIHLNAWIKEQRKLHGLEP